MKSTKGVITAFLSEYCATFILYVYFFLIIVPPEFTTHPQSQSIAEGKNVTLSCNASGNPESTSFSWTIGESPVNTTANPRISFSLDKKQLIITNVNRADSGPYRCVANNSVENTKSSVATLDVQCKYDGFLRPVYIHVEVRWALFSVVTQKVGLLVEMVSGVPYCNFYSTM